MKINFNKQKYPREKRKEAMEKLTADISLLLTAEQQTIYKQMTEQAIAQHIGQTVRGTEQHHPPDVAQQINQHTQTKQPRQIAHQGTIVETALGDAIHHPAHHFGRNNGQQGHHQQQRDGGQIAGPLLLEKPAHS